MEKNKRRRKETLGVCEMEFREAKSLGKRKKNIIK